MRMLENRAQKRIFGPKREEIMRGWRRLHNEELHNLYASANIIRVIKAGSIKWAGCVARMGLMTCIKILVVNREGKKPFERSRRRWGDNFRLNLREIRWESVD
jgi:hypothetical protein